MRRWRKALSVRGSPRSPVASSPKTATALAELLARPLNEVDLVALMVDGVHCGEQTCLVALAIDITGVKHPLAIVQGHGERHRGA